MPETRVRLVVLEDNVKPLVMVRVKASFFVVVPLVPVMVSV